jgi:hypothetical protein
MFVMALRIVVITASQVVSCDQAQVNHGTKWSHVDNRVIRLGITKETM